MDMTNDQYIAVHLLEKWYRKYNKQFIEISGTVGTGVYDIVDNFITDISGIDKYSVMYLSHNQRDVLELISKGHHAFQFDNAIYKYHREVDFDTIPLLNKDSVKEHYEWKKRVRKKIDKRYKMIVVLDSSLLSVEKIKDLGSFGIPVILLKDPMLLPDPSTYTFLRDANITLRDIHPKYTSDPLVYFTHRMLANMPLKIGTYDKVSIINKQMMNLYNLKSSDMIITSSQELRDEINILYRAKITKAKDFILRPNERLICMTPLRTKSIMNEEENRVKLFITKGMVGTACNIKRHYSTSRYVEFDFQLDYYYDPFQDLHMDHQLLNNLKMFSRQVIPDDEIGVFEYAYALTPGLSRISSWDKVTIINDEHVSGLHDKMAMYTAMTRARKSLTIVL